MGEMAQKKHKRDELRYGHHHTIGGMIESSVLSILKAHSDLMQCQSSNCLFEAATLLACIYPLPKNRTVGINSISTEVMRSSCVCPCSFLCLRSQTAITTKHYYKSTCERVGGMGWSGGCLMLSVLVFIFFFLKGVSICF